MQYWFNGALAIDRHDILFRTGARPTMQLRQFVLLALDGQLLNGDGVSPNLHGLLTRADLTPPHAVGTDSVPDAILKQIAAVQLAGGKIVDGIVMNPSDFLGISILKSTTGEYIGASPFETPIAPTLWGRPVALTPKMPQERRPAPKFEPPKLMNLNEPRNHLLGNISRKA